LVTKYNGTLHTQKTLQLAEKIERKTLEGSGDVTRMGHRRADRNAYYGKPESNRGETGNERAGRCQDRLTST
jgi:hypothetical protein